MTAVTEAQEACRFCAIIHGTESSYVVYEDAASIVFLDHRPLFHGHSLVVPKHHYPTLLDVPASLLVPLFSTVQLIARALEQGLDAEGSFIAINTRISQSVPHFHIHVIPRRRGDGLHGFFWPRHAYPDAATIHHIQQVLAATVQTLTNHNNTN
jgi:histidine triad (HIT) family protein